MPIYEYACPHCSAEFEELVRNRDEVVECPECGADDVGRKLSVFAFKSTGSDRPSASSASSSCGGCAKSSCSGCGHH